jgi:hypothetical protein
MHYIRCLWRDVNSSNQGRYAAFTNAVCRLLFTHYVRYLQQIVLNVYTYIPETAKLSGQCTQYTAWSCRKAWRNKHTTGTRNDVTIHISLPWKISCLLFSCVSTIVDILSLFASYKVRTVLLVSSWGLIFRLTAWCCTSICNTMYCWVSLKCCLCVWHQCT